jgi:transposase
VLDRAGFHTGKGVRVPDGVEFEFPPPRSPELQPAERLWPLTNEGIANRLFADLDELQKALTDRCVTLAGDPESIRSHTLFHWWPQAA